MVAVQVNAVREMRLSFAKVIRAHVSPRFKTHQTVVVQVRDKSLKTRY